MHTNDHPGTPRILYVVPCGAEKRDQLAPARLLYTSHHFGRTLAAAEHLAHLDTEDGYQASVLILSALHGLVDPNRPLAPYDVRMGDPGSVDQRAIAFDLLTELTDVADVQGLNPADARITVYALLPKAYRNALDGAARAVCELLDSDCVLVHDVFESAPFGPAGGIGYQRNVVGAALMTT